jgi:hypothetical protein
MHGENFIKLEGVMSKSCEFVVARKKGVVTDRLRMDSVRLRLQG